MLPPALLHTIFVLLAVGIILNAFGIYCLRQQRGGNANQRRFLQNLSLIEIIKMVWDYVPLCTYNYSSGLYEKCYIYLDIIEVNIMTILFSSILLVTIDRLSCVLLTTRYKQYVRESFVTEVIITTWLIGLTSGWFIFAMNSEQAKADYYLTFDIIIVAMSVITYSLIVKLLGDRKRKFVKLRQMTIKSRGVHVEKHKGNLRMLFVPSAIITSYVLFNAIPDIVFNFWFTNATYQVSLVLWTLGVSVDPVIYIFLNKGVRNTAKETLQPLFCHTWLARQTEMFTHRGKRKILDVQCDGSTTSSSLCGTKAVTEI